MNFFLNALQEKMSTVEHYQTLMSKKQREYQQSLDRCKKAQAQEQTEQQHKVEMVSVSLKVQYVGCSLQLHIMKASVKTE